MTEICLKNTKCRTLYTKLLSVVLPLNKNEKLKIAQTTVTVVTVVCFFLSLLFGETELFAESLRGTRKSIESVNIDVSSMCVYCLSCASISYDVEFHLKMAITISDNVRVCSMPDVCVG